MDNEQMLEQMRLQMQRQMDWERNVPFKITLSDGTEITGSKKNGSYLVADTEEEITSDIFVENLCPVTIEERGVEITYERATVAPILYFDDQYFHGWGIAISPIPKDTMERTQMKADISFLSMMTGYPVGEGGIMTLAEGDDSPKYSYVRSMYKQHYWNIEQVGNAVEKGWITSDEFYKITGELYS